MDKLTTVITPVAPFDFALTAGYHTYFQARYGTDSLEGGVYRRLLDLGNKLVLASVQSVGTCDEPRLTVELQGESLDSDEVSAATEQVKWILGTNEELAPFYDIAKQDPTMSAIVDRFWGLHLPHTASVFEAMVQAITAQQVATNVAGIIRTLMIETHGPQQTFDKETFYAFPRPETLVGLSVDQLRELKLSQRKAEYVQGIARAELEVFPGGLESLRLMSDEEVVQTVIALRGVGHWTAQWVLIRALGRPDALPLGDLALRRTVSRVYFGGDELTDAQVEEFSRRWSPWRAYATVYLFTAQRSGMG